MTSRLTLGVPSVCFTMCVVLVVTGPARNQEIAKGPANAEKPQDKASPRTAWHVERAMWKASGRADTVKAYSEFLVARAGTDADRPAIPALVEKLASAKFKERDEAVSRLKAIGNAAVPALRKAAAGKDAEAADLAKQCLAEITKGAEDHLIYAAVRLLRASGAPEGVEGLLAFLPYAGDLELEAEIMDVIAALGGSPGKVNPTLKAALASDVPERRSMAAGLVARFGTAEEQEVAAKMLADPHPLVRLRVAQVMGGRGDERVYRPLAGLLTAKPVSTVAWPAEEMLRWLADGTAPEELIWAGGESAQKAQAAWRKWLDVRDKAPKPAKWERPGGRPMLILDINERHDCRVFGHDGVTRWEPLPERDLRPKDHELWLRTFGEQRPDVRQLLPGDRVLVVRQTSNRIDRPIAPNSKPNLPMQIFEVNQYTFDGVRVEGFEVEVRRGVDACHWANGRVTLLEADRIITTSLNGAIAEDYRINQRLDLGDLPENGTSRTARALDLGDGTIEIEVETDSARNSKSYESMQVTPIGTVVWREPAAGTVVNRWDRPFRQGDGHGLLRRNNSWADVAPSGQPEAILSLIPVRRLGPNRYLLVDEERNRLVEANGEGRVFLEIPRLSPTTLMPQAGTVPAFDLKWTGFGLTPDDAPNPERDVASRLRQLRSPDVGRRHLAALAIRANKELQVAEMAAPLLRLRADVLTTPLATVKGGEPWRIRLAGPSRNALDALGGLAWPAAHRAATDPESSEAMRVAGLQVLRSAERRKLAPSGADVWPLVNRALKDRSAFVRESAVFLIQSYMNERSSDVVREATAVLGDAGRRHPGEPPVGWHAARMLGHMQSRAADAVPALLGVAKKGDSWIRCGALEALGQIAASNEKQAAEVMPLLRAALQGDSDPMIRAVAAEAIGQFGARAEAAIPDLIETLRDPAVTDGPLRRCCVSALAKFGPAAATAVPVLIKILESQSLTQEVSLAILALKAIGRDARPAIPAIEASKAPEAPDAIRAIQGK